MAGVGVGAPLTLESLNDQRVASSARLRKSRNVTQTRFQEIDHTIQDHTESIGDLTDKLQKQLDSARQAHDAHTKAETDLKTAFDKLLERCARQNDLFE